MFVGRAVLPPINSNLLSKLYVFFKLSWTSLPLSNSNLNTTSVITQLRQFSFLFLKLWNHDEWSPKNPCLGIWTPVHSNFKKYVTLRKTVVTYSLAKLSFLLSLLRKQLQLFKDSQKRYKDWSTIYGPYKSFQYQTQRISPLFGLQCE